VVAILWFRILMFSLLRSVKFRKGGLVDYFFRGTVVAVAFAGAGVEVVGWVIAVVCGGVGVFKLRGDRLWWVDGVMGGIGGGGQRR
jgi:hypothetical protein